MYIIIFTNEAMLRYLVEVGVVVAIVLFQNYFLLFVL